MKKVLLVVFIVVCFSSNLYGELAHFTFTSYTGNSATAVITVESNPKISMIPLSILDEIGVFTPAGLCVGAIVWEGLDVGITIWGDDVLTPEIDGALIGEQLSFRVWDASSNSEISSVFVTYSMGDGKYSINGLHILASLVATAKPGKPSFTNPTNNSNGVSLSGNLTWNPASDATSHTIQLSATDNFATTIVNTSGNITSTGYIGLSHNTNYYARVKGSNSDGDGDWDNISFKTLTSDQSNQIRFYSKNNSQPKILDIEDIQKIAFKNIGEQYTMKLYYSDTLTAYYPLIAIDTIKFETDTNNIKLLLTLTV